MKKLIALVIVAILIVVVGILFGTAKVKYASQQDWFEYGVIMGSVIIFEMLEKHESIPKGKTPSNVVLERAYKSLEKIHGVKGISTLFKDGQTLKERIKKKEVLNEKSNLTDKYL